MSKKQSQSPQRRGGAAGRPPKQTYSKGPVLSRRPPRQPGR